MGRSVGAGSRSPGTVTRSGPSPPEAPRSTSAVVFAYEEEPALRRGLPALLGSPVDEIVVMYGGHDGSGAFLESLRDPRLRLEYEAERIGKWRAYNRAIEQVRGEVVFLISGDVRFGPDLVDRLLGRFTPDTGVVFPRVVPTNGGTMLGRLGRTLWDVHDRQIVDFGARGLPVHGGELQAVRRTLLEPLDGVINEDAYLCLRAVERGYRVVYDRSTVVYNTVPETVADFFRQRVRVNYGHRQLAAAGLRPSTLDRLVFEEPGACLGVLGRVVADRPANAVRLPLLAGLELVAHTQGERDYRHGVDHGRWSLVRSGKGGLLPPAPSDAPSSVPEQ